MTKEENVNESKVVAAKDYIHKQNFTPVKQDHGASTSRHNHVPRTPLSLLTNGISYFDHFSEFLSKKHKNPTYATSTTADLTSDAGSVRRRMKLIRNKDTHPTKYVNGVAELRPHTHMSEVINPTSIHVTKRVFQPTHVLVSIPLFDLNFHGESTVEPVVIECTSMNEQRAIFHSDRYT
ncbi:unnamed protein product [Vicia faba]|uniref:Uncharacterized protein n=1 Tax=Vicia faba TaxID=3906 RepID=A0AAV1B6G4_VICFA|nr:unnamed protein product [Vicia faba]